MQKTLRTSVDICGIGLHTGAAVRLRLRPAAPHTGIIFVRTDLGGAVIPALWRNVVDTRLCTVLGVGAARVGTVEHLMAALAGLGVDNVRMEIDGPEVPVMDGSALAFVEAIDSVGMLLQPAPRHEIEIMRPLRVEAGEAWASLTPSKMSTFSGQIDFIHPSIGRQDMRLALTPQEFRAEVAMARTFGFADEVEAMRAAGLARGGSLDNAVVLDEAGVMNAEGLRAPDEFVRHKVLDAVGDMALCGGFLRGAYVAHRPSHALNNMLLRILMTNPAAWRQVGGVQQQHLLIRTQRARVAV